MTRRPYGLLAIAQRHPHLFAAMHHTAKQRSDVEDRSDGTVRANAAMRFDMEAEAALEQLRVLRGEPYRWRDVPWRSDSPQRRRIDPSPSRFNDLEHA